MHLMHYLNNSIPIKYSFRVIKIIKDNCRIDLTHTAAPNLLIDWFEGLDNQEYLFYQMIKEGHRQENQPCLIALTDMEQLMNDHYEALLQVYKEDALAFVTPKSKWTFTGRTVETPTVSFEHIQSYALVKGLSLSDFLSLTPVELDYFFFAHNEDDLFNKAFHESQTRLINTFVFNSNPYLKGTQRVKDPAKLYAISTEFAERERAKNDVRFARLPKSEIDAIKSYLASLN